MNQVDACGLSCPQPVLLAVWAMEKAGSGSIEILVDNVFGFFNIFRKH